MKTFLVTGVALAALLGMGGCASQIHPIGVRPVTDRLVAAGPSPWRLDFGDPILRDLLRRSDLGSLDVKIALARLARADAEAQITRAMHSPQVQIGANAAVGGHSYPERTAAASPSLSAGYELDLWGRMADERAAVEHDLRAAGSEVTMARRMVGAEVAQGYFALRAAQSLRDVLITQRENAEQLRALTQARYREGRTGRDEVASRDQALADLDAKLVEAALDVRIESLRLGALLGETAEFSVAAPDSRAFDLPLYGAISSEAVIDRPDIEAAYARLQAADRRRAQAVAATRPRFAISVSLGAADPSIINLLDVKSLAWALAAEVTQTIFDGGARKARVGAAAAEADLADLAYRKSVVQGWADARSALARVVAADEELAKANAQRQAGRGQIERMRRRHDEGAADALDVLTAQDLALTAEIRANAARLRAVATRIDLTLAAPGA